jgi:hypothetical protein
MELEEVFDFIIVALSGWSDFSPRFSIPENRLLITRLSAHG